MSTDRRTHRLGLTRTPKPTTFKKAWIIGLMVIGSLSLWIANPVFWLWSVSKLQSDGTQASMGPYGLMLVGIVLGSVLIGKGLAALSRFYGKVIGKPPVIHMIVPWRRSLRGGRSRRRETDGRAPVGVLDVVMVTSVLLAVMSFSTWYLVANPTPPNVGGPGPAKH